MDAHRGALTHAYPDEFIAVKSGGVQDHDVDLMVLADRLQDREIPSNEVAWSSTLLENCFKERPQSRVDVVKVDYSGPNGQAVRLAVVQKHQVRNGKL